MSRMAAAAAAAAQCSSTVQQHSSIITVCVHEIELLQVRVWGNVFPTIHTQDVHRLIAIVKQIVSAF